MIEPGKVREAVGVFKEIDAMNRAIAELESTAFGHETISVLGSKCSLEKQFGTPGVSPEQVEDNPNTPRQVPVHPEERAIGAGVLIGGGAYVGAVGTLLASEAAIAVPALITAAVLGGSTGGLLAKILGDNFDENMEKQIEDGGIVLWVKTGGPKRENIACNILKKYGAKHVHIHEIT